jgi:hypothetical protein
MIKWINIYNSIVIKYFEIISQNVDRHPPYKISVYVICILLLIVPICNYYIAALNSFLLRNHIVNHNSHFEWIKSLVER